jgi:tetratricopeptide (TPR) repeat protein
MQRGGNDGSVPLAVGLGALRAGDLATAKAALAKLAPAEEGGDPATRYGGAAGVAEKELGGMIQLAEGKTEEGLKLLAEAAELEAKMPPPMGPPVPIKPAQELFGEALLDLGRAERAAAQFEQALLRMPNRTASLLGAARAAVKLGQTETARARYAALAAIWKDADPELAEASEARQYRSEGSRPAAR